MHSKNYNLIPLSIDQGLNRVPIGTAGGYIRLLEAPAAANVQIHLNEQNADGIPLKTYHAIEATNIEKIFVSCNAVPGEKITVVQANTAQDFKMVTPASDVKLSSLGSYESVALDQLDKIINPYQYPTTSVVENTTTTETTIFNKTLTCDKIYIKTSCGIASSNNHRNVTVLIDNIIVSTIDTYAHGTYLYEGSENNETMTFEGVNGKTVEIRATEGSALISEYTLK